MVIFYVLPFFFVIRHRFFFQFIVSLKIKDTKQKTIIYFLKIAKKSLQDVFNLKRIDGFIEDISIELDKLIRSLEIYICEFVIAKY